MNFGKAFSGTGPSHQPALGTHRLHSRTTLGSLRDCQAARKAQPVLPSLSPVRPPPPSIAGAPAFLVPLLHAHKTRPRSRGAGETKQRLPTTTPLPRPRATETAKGRTPAKNRRARARAHNITQGPFLASLPASVPGDEPPRRIALRLQYPLVERLANLDGALGEGAGAGSCPKNGGPHQKVLLCCCCRRCPCCCLRSACGL